MQLLGQPCRNRPAEFARSSLSAWGLPTPIVVLACIGSVDIRVFSGAGGQLYLIRRLKAVYSLPYEVYFLGQPCQNRPAEFARTSLSAWGLPTPVVALACIGNVDIQVLSSAGG